MVFPVFMMSLLLFIGGILVSDVMEVEKTALGVVIFLMPDLLWVDTASSLIFSVPGLDLIVSSLWELPLTTRCCVSFVSSGVTYSFITGQPWFFSCVN